MNQEQLSALKKQIDDIVDKWVSETLRDRLIKGTDDKRPNSLWDRIKQGVSNWWYGPQGEKENPYRWTNRFGGRLGVEESFSPSVFTLHEYAEIKWAVDSLESVVNESVPEFNNLRLAKILLSSAEELKSKLFNLFKDKVVAASAPSASPVSTATAPAAPMAAQGSPPEGAVAKTQKKAGGTSPVTVDSKPSKSPPTRAATSRKPAGDAASGGKNTTPNAQAKENLSSPKAKQKGEEDDKGDLVVNKNEQLIGYLQDEKAGKRYDLDDAAEKITSFFMSVDSFSKSESLNNWWSGKVDEYIKDSLANGEGSGLDKLWGDLVVNDTILDALEKNAGVPKAEIKKMMIDHLAGQTAPPAEPNAKKQDAVGEEENSSLGLDAYFTTEGKADNPDVAAAKIEKFIANPMSAVGGSTNPTVVEALAGWWRGVKKEMEEASDKRDFLSKNMSEKADDKEYIPPFVGQIANVMNKSAKFVANLMRAHIRKKSNRQ